MHIVGVLKRLDLHTLAAPASFIRSNCKVAGCCHGQGLQGWGLGVGVSFQYTIGQYNVNTLIRGPIIIFRGGYKLQGLDHPHADYYQPGDMVGRAQVGRGVVGFGNRAG